MMAGPQTSDSKGGKSEKSPSSVHNVSPRNVSTDAAEVFACFECSIITHREMSIRSCSRSKLVDCLMTEGQIANRNPHSVDAIVDSPLKLLPYMARKWSQNHALCTKKQFYNYVNDSSCVFTSLAH